MAERNLSAELVAYIDGELGEADRRAVEAALGKDPALRAEEARLRAVVSAVEALPSPASASSPAALKREVLARLDAPPSLLERLGALFARPGLAPAGLAVAAAATAVVLWPRSEESRDEPSEGEQLALAENLELVEDLDLMELDSAEDLEVIAKLHELEVQR